MLFRSQLDGIQTPFLAFSVPQMTENREEAASKMIREFRGFYDKLRQDIDARKKFEKKQPGAILVSICVGKISLIC